MLLTFQMQHAVDNQKTQEFFISAVEILRFFPHDTAAQDELAAISGERKRQHVGRPVLLSVFFVELAGFSRTDIRNREGIIFPQDVVLYFSELALHFYLDTILPSFLSFSISFLRTMRRRALFLTLSLDSLRSL